MQLLPLQAGGRASVLGATQVPSRQSGTSPARNLGRVIRVIRDTTQLENGGSAKPGIVQLSFTDAAVSMAGIPLTANRVYDSRDAQTKSDFGYGWSLNVRQGSAQHNRPVGDGFAIYTPEQEFSLPCTGLQEQKSHYTVIRISDREQYIFRAAIFNAEPVAGACEAEAGFDFVEGSTAGAQLFVLGGMEETRVREPDPEIVFNPNILDRSELIYAFDPERGVFNPQNLRLELADGRAFHLNVQRGITHIEDRHGNAVSFNPNGITHSGGRSLFFERDLQGRITGVQDSAGRTVQYAYDLRGDLARVTDPLGRVTRLVYHSEHPHHLASIIGPDGTEVAALGYDGSGRLTEACDAEGACTQSSYDLSARTVTQVDATSRPVAYSYDGRGNVLSQTDGLDHTVSFQYDAQDNLTRAEGPDGSVATYSYDASGNLLTRVLPYEAGEDPADFTYSYTYSARNDRESVTLPSGGVIEHEYDAAGNLTATRDGFGNAVESRSYHADGTLATRTDRFGTTHYSGYADGQPTQVIDPFGELISLSYDDRGLLLSRTERGATVSYEYDALGRVLVEDHTERGLQAGAGNCVNDLDCDGTFDSADNCAYQTNATQQDSDSGALNTPGATAVWRFEEASGTSALDAVGTGHGTLTNGVERVEGRAGQGLRFDGVDDFVSSPNLPAALQGSFTLELWAFAEATHKQTTQKTSGVDGTSGMRYAIYPTNGAAYGAQHAGAGISVGTNGISVLEHGGNYLPSVLVWNHALSGWKHVVVVYNNGQPSLYVDGVHVATGLTSGKVVHPSARLGELGVGYGYYAGRLDEVAIFDRALTPSEIALHAQQGLYGDGVGDACDPCPSDASASCAPTTCTDVDGDGYGLQGSSACGTGHDALFDCNDTNPSIHPGQSTDACDELDNDCDGTRDEGCAPEIIITYEYGDPGDTRWTAIEGTTLGRVERSFTASGRIGSWTEPNGDSFTRHYDPSGRVSEEVDALGNRTTYGYDSAGRLEAITDVTLGATTTFERDAAGRVTSTLDALGHETLTAYKLGGRLASTTNARGHTTAFDRDPVTSSITDALSRTTVTSLTQLGLPVSTSYPGGASTGSSYRGTTRLDSSQSFPTGFTDEQLRARDFGYDSHSGLSSATDLAGQSWQYAYSPSAGSAVRYDVMSGSVSVGHHDGGAGAYGGLGGGTEYRDVSAVQGDGGSEHVHQLAQVTSPLGETTRFMRGLNGRIERIQYPDGGIKRISYGSDARPEAITLPQGTTIAIEHDAVGRESARTSSLGESRSFTYGSGDRIETMTDDTGTTSYSYDPSGRFVGITYPHGGSVAYTRDVLDRVTAVRVRTTATAAESVTQYAYDNNGNLATVTDPLNGVTQYVYDQVDRLTHRTLPNGVVTSYGYDARDRVLSIEHRGPMSNVLASVTYVRSASGEPTRITREDGGYVLLTYDAALRIDTETYYNASGTLLDANDYGYDLDGNRISKDSLAGGFESYTHAAGFKLTSITTTAGTESYGYDDGGRNTSITRGGVQRALEYSSDDKVTRVLAGGSELVRYAYDGAGRRVGKTEGGNTTRYLVAPNLGDGFETPQAVTDGSGALIASYVFAGEQPIARITSSGVEYYLQDAMGSVIGMADGSGASTASIKYDSFGTVTSAVGASAGIPSSVGTDFRYHGMQLDAGTGLYHVRARTYDARTGRFTSRDPVAGRVYGPESYHPYAFANSNPSVWRDPSGQTTINEQMAVVAIVGLMATYAVANTGLQFLQNVRTFRDISFDIRLGRRTAPQSELPERPPPSLGEDQIPDLTEPDPQSDRTIWYHYTSESGYGQIEQSGVIRANKGVVYLTKSQVGTALAFYALFAGNPHFNDKGTHVIALTLRDGTFVVPGTQRNEWIHRGSLYNGRNMDIQWMGPNPY